MSTSAAKYAFNPEDVAQLSSAYRKALREMRGRPEWRRRLGSAQIRDIAARTVIRAAEAGISSPDVLQDMALKAVTVSFLRSTN